VPPLPPPTEIQSRNAADNAESTTVRTANFTVTAPTHRLARLVAEEAERQRKALAVRWLGKELHPWPNPCAIEIKFSVSGGSGGATTFSFVNGEVRSRNMQLEGSLDKILGSLLPHEVTHTILADHFRGPIPRWADEGAAILAEDTEEQKRHDQHTRKILDTPGRVMPLEWLMKLTDFPPDVMVLYAEGYSLTRFLVERKDHKTFLAFVKQGMTSDWDEAVKDHFGLANVRELEAVWLAHLKANHAPLAVTPPSGNERLAATLTLATARVEKDTLILVLPGASQLRYRPVTSYVMGSDKVVRPVTQYALEKEPADVRFDLGNVKAWSAAGKPLEMRTLRQRLRERTSVLVSDQGSGIDPALLRLVKEDTLILFACEPALPPVVPLYGQVEVLQVPDSPLPTTGRPTPP
jgi:hypothetical protein